MCPLQRQEMAPIWASLNAFGSDLGSLSGPELQDQGAQMYKVKNTDVSFGPFETVDLWWASPRVRGLLTVSVGQRAMS